MDKQTIPIEVTSEQHETIKSLFMHNDWEYKEIRKQVKRKRKTTSMVQNKSRLHLHNNNAMENEKFEDPLRNSDEPEFPLRNANMSDDPTPNHPDVPLDDGQCGHCFLSPCVTRRNLGFVGYGRAACHENSELRCKKYKKYWFAISNLGGWTLEPYIRTKVARGNGGEWAIVHDREVMPKCVLLQLRSLYPNPKGKPYMDHKWE